MKIVAFVSSHSHDGNTATAAKRLLQGAADAGAETEIVYLNEYDIKCCRGCRVCEKTNECVIKERKPGVMIFLSGNHGEKVFDSHIKVGYFLFNDLNAYPWREVLIPKTSWKATKDQPEKMEELYRTGADLVHHIEAGEAEDTARTQHFYERYRLLKY